MVAEEEEEEEGRVPVLTIAVTTVPGAMPGPVTGEPTVSRGAGVERREEEEERDVCWGMFTV